MDIFRKNLNKYTRKAFEIIPKIEMPDILEIGCGSGVGTIELSGLTNGKIVAIDIDETQLKKLSDKVNMLGLHNKIEILQLSMFDMDFPDDSFDIIWAEGSIYAIGFKKGLKTWKTLLKPHGYLVVHDDKKGLSKKMEIITKTGYELINYFILSKEVWWNEYYKLIEEYIAKLRLSSGFKLEEEHIRNLREIEMYKKNPDKFQSVCFVMQKM